jgi:heptosyltransferase II
VKDKGKFVPSPIVKYYLGLAHYLGATDRNIKLELFVTPFEQREADEILARCSLPVDLNRPASRGSSPLVMLNPGAQYGAAKCWIPANFAAVGDRLHEELGATILISGTPKERRILDEVQARMRHKPIDLSTKGTTLGALKDIIRRCDLMITNDTGPRHIAAAFDVPVVTVFGPTHPEWTEIYFAKERKVSVPVFCGPCQKKTCPLDHRCMTLVTPEMVVSQAIGLLPARQPQSQF